MYFMTIHSTVILDKRYHKTDRGGVTKTETQRDRQTDRQTEKETEN